MSRVLLVDLVPVLGFVYLTEMRSRSRRGRRFELSYRSAGGAAAPVFGVAWVVTVVSVLALVVAPDYKLASPLGLANSSAVLVVMMLVVVIGAFLHNRAVDRR